ncbi:PucR family transcriptional regulator [[Clostridium] dakarense]|uniref:PucR family transcriptional regulator n=1 Tax=Faecalimicrobium dakarense TaxID=1301100 RepID=UPI0004BAF86B|nr:helix-turn-helix domain-containing protein [[Clostridium] dakarense]
MYEDISIFEHKRYFIVNSKNKLDIDESTPEIIESETYRNTYIAYIGKIDNLETFNNRISILDEVFPLIINDTYSKKFLDLHDLTIYKIINLIGNENFYNNLIDFESIKNMDENLLYTGINFIENDFNITKTSNSLFLHRNTLIYRLEKIKEILNLDLKNFRDSFVFYLSIKSYLTYHL